MAQVHRSPLKDPPKIRHSALGNGNDLPWTCEWSICPACFFSAKLKTHRAIWHSFKPEIIIAIHSCASRVLITLSPFFLDKMREIVVELINIMHLDSEGYQWRRHPRSIDEKRSLWENKGLARELDEYSNFECSGPRPSRKLHYRISRVSIDFDSLFGV